MKLLLIDGNSLINRAFYGVRPLTAPDGTPTNAVYGFLTTLRRLLDDEKPERVVVAFDRKEPTFRHLAYTEYKAGRRETPDELRSQITLLKETLDKMGICRREIAGWEADDLLGTLAREGEALGWDCAIVTGDKDALQLITDRTRVLNVRTSKGITTTYDYTPAVFEEEYGFPPLGMVDLKALMGDSSDNIPGVPGVGEKTAMDLMHRFGSLGGVYAALDDPAIKKGVRAKLEAGQESARMSYDLATIRRDAPVEDTLDKALYTGEYGPELYELFRRLNFAKFIESWHLSPSAAPAAAPAEAEETVSGECDGFIVTSEDKLKEFLAASEGKTVYIWYEAERAELSLQYGATAAFLSPEAYEGDYNALLALALGPDIPKAGHEIKDILRSLMDRGVDACENWVFDSALAAWLLDSSQTGHDIGVLCRAHCGFEPWKRPDGEAQMSLLDEPAVPDLTLRMGESNSMAAAVEALEEILRTKLRDIGGESVLDDIELPLCAVLARMEHAGIAADRAALDRFGTELGESIALLQEQIWKEAGEEFNINSPKQLGVILFEKRKLPGGKKTKTGWSTNADVLDRLRYDPLVRYVLEYRELAKLKSTYADGLARCIAPDGRIHTNFRMTATSTGRLSSTDPNLQNIPVRKELGAGLRQMFTAGKGCVLVDADYSQIELRILAHISGDKNMQEAFLSGEDVHRATAAAVFGLAPEDVTSEERRRAKAVNFGIVYGISAFSLSQDIDTTVTEAKEYMEAYLTRFSGVKAWQDAIKAEAKEQGWVATLYGRRRYLPELRNTNFNLRSFGERAAMNAPIQGSAADIIKLAMIRTDRRLRQELPEARLILQVHDELIVECPEDKKEAAAAILTDEMRHVADLAVPLLAEAGFGKTWAEAH